MPPDRNSARHAPSDLDTPICLVEACGHEWGHHYVRTDGNVSCKLCYPRHGTVCGRVRR